MFVPSKTFGIAYGDSWFDLAVKTETLGLTRLAAIFYWRVLIGWFFLQMINRQISQVQQFIIIFGVPEIYVLYRLLQTVLFLTDSVFRVLFAYFDESMTSIGGYEP